MDLRAAFCALALASIPLAACSRDETPPPTPAAVPAPSDASDRARAELEDTTRALQVDEALQQLPAGESPASLSEEDMAEARKAIESMLEGVKKELEEKSAVLGKPAPPNAPVAPDSVAPKP